MACRTRTGLLGVRRVGDRESLEMFSVMCLSNSSSKDSKVAGRCCSLSAAGPEGVPTWACSGGSAATNEWSCAVSMGGGDWGEDTEGLGGMEDIREGLALYLRKMMRPAGFKFTF